MTPADKIGAEVSIYGNARGRLYTTYTRPHSFFDFCDKLIQTACLLLCLLTFIVFCAGGSYASSPGEDGQGTRVTSASRDDPRRRHTAGARPRVNK